MPDELTQTEQTGTALPDTASPADTTDASAQPQPTQSVPAPQPPQDGPVQPQPQPQPVQIAPPSVQQAPVSPAPVKPAPVPQTRGQMLARSLQATLDVLAPNSYKTTYSADGIPTRTPVPRTRAQIGLALAVEALSGGLAGLAQSGPASIGKAGQAGLEMGIKIGQSRQQAQKDADDQAQTDYQTQQSVLTKRAANFETVARGIQNVSTAEKMGADALDSLIEINRKSGVTDIPSQYLDNAGQPLTQLELSQRLASNSLRAGDHLGPVIGREEVTMPDGTKQWQGLHLVILDPNQKIPLTQDQYNYYAQQGVPGFPTNISIGPNTQLPLRMIQNASEIAGAHVLANKRLDALRTMLDGTPYQSKLPTSIDFKTPGMNSAFETYNRYISHNAENLADPYLALQAMAQGRRDPQTGEMLSNKDAGAVPVVMDALGGPEVLLAAHNKLVADAKTQEQYNVVDSLEKAQAVVADKSNKFTPAQVSSARSYIAQDVQHKSAVAEAGADARASVKAATDAAMANAVTGTADPLGFVPNVASFGGAKGYSTRLASFKKNADAMAQTEATYQQFSSTLNDLASGRGMSGAASVVALFSAIGLSATPLAGRGFRVSENVIKEHEQARGWGQAIQAKLLNAQVGDVITPDQVKSYAGLAVQARQNAYVNLTNELHSSGLAADLGLPTGNGQKIDPSTAQIFLHLTGNNPKRARQAATAKGWSF